MIKTYLLTSFRALLRNKTFALLNIIGLSVGIAGGILILQYVQHELAFDQFHEHAERLVRVDHRFIKDGKTDFESARTFPRVGPAMHEDFAEVENYCRIIPEYRGGLLRYNDLAFHQDNIWFADTSFVSMFSFPWIAGDRKSALRDINTAVLEESVARKYFGGENPIGKRMTIGSMNGLRDIEVRGVFRNPSNSHLQLAVVISYQTIISQWGQRAHDYWGWYDFHTYLLLKPGVDESSIESKLAAFVDRHGGERMGSKRVELSLRPITDIHLESNLMMEADTNGSSRTVYFMLILGLAILGIAWINYVNMATAHAMERAKEVGVRKVSGSSRWQLAVQFMMEAGIVNAISIIIGIGLIIAFTPMFNQLTGKSFDSSLLLQAGFFTQLLTLFVVGSIVTGIYPAFVLSSFRPISVLKGRVQNMVGGNLLRKGLVVGQFMASVILIAGTIIVSGQLRHLQSVDLGIDINNTLVVKAPEVINDNVAYNQSLNLYRDEMLSSHQVSSATVSSEIPGRQVSWYGGAKRVGIDQEAASAILYMTTMDPNYFSLFDIDVIAGKTYEPGRTLDTVNAVINTRALEALGFANAEEAVQGKIVLRGDTMNIIGVVEDYHHESPKDDYRPSVYLLSEEERQFFAFKVDGNPHEIVERSQLKFANMFPGEPFNYFFLNDMYSAQYESENKFLTMFMIFAGLAILIASLGLFGLSAYTISKRTKEVGIRKVLGSTGWQVFGIFLKEFSILVIVGNLVAIPITWYVMNQWLSSFAERIAIGAGAFIATTLITMLISMATISYHAWKSSTLNPAKALRSE